MEIHERVVDGWMGRRNSTYKGSEASGYVAYLENRKIIMVTAIQSGGEHPEIKTDSLCTDCHVR